MTHYRTARLNEQLKREIAHILRQKVRDPRVGEISVMDVRVTSDLWLARVFVRILEEGGGEEEALAGLEAAAPFIRKELGKVLHIRRIPELRFIHDTTLDSARRIEEVLKEVLPEGEPSSPASGAREGNEEIAREAFADEESSTESRGPEEDEPEEGKEGG